MNRFTHNAIDVHGNMNMSIYASTSTHTHTCTEQEIGQAIGSKINALSLKKHKT